MRARLIAESRDLIEELKLIMAPHPEVLYTGFFQDAQKEYAEASLTFEIITKAQLSSHQELDVDAAVYLNGLGKRPASYGATSWIACVRATSKNASEFLSTWKKYTGYW